MEIERKRLVPTRNSREPQIPRCAWDDKFGTLRDVVSELKAPNP